MIVKLVNLVEENQEQNLKDHIQHVDQPKHNVMMLKTKRKVQIELVGKNQKEKKCMQVVLLEVKELL